MEWRRLLQRIPLDCGYPCRQADADLLEVVSFDNGWDPYWKLFRSDHSAHEEPTGTTDPTWLQGATDVHVKDIVADRIVEDDVCTTVRSYRPNLGRSLSAKIAERRGDLFESDEEERATRNCLVPV